MGKAWDEDKGGRKQWVAWMTEVMAECLRVLKPGAHGLVWAIPRTSHWTATALEDAGFEIRDVVTHLFGSGFPKSMDISKAIDKQAGAEREVIGPSARHGGGTNLVYGEGMGDGEKTFITAPSTDGAKQWQGWGTALKPASEHWILVRKPTSEKTVAANVLKHGVGGINVDASRIGYGAAGPDRPFDQVVNTSASHWGNSSAEGLQKYATNGRFPANLVLSHNPNCEESCTPGCTVAALDEQSGVLKSGAHKDTHSRTSLGGNKNTHGEMKGVTGPLVETSSGGASRFFYCAKASKKDKGTDNTHPTVKSSSLMTYLIKLITPPEGIVLDPFAGSGSTGVAAVKAGFAFIGIEKETEYYEIANKRIEAA